MAAQDKHYIEPNDIRAIRFDCKTCGASLSLKLGADIPTTKCPGGCGDDWFAPKDWLRDSIKSFMNEVQSLPQPGSDKKFTVSLEIASDLCPGDKDEVAPDATSGDTK